MQHIGSGLLQVTVTVLRIVCEENDKISLRTVGSHDMEKKGYSE
jgi:hypothetical protein